MLDFITIVSIFLLIFFEIIFTLFCIKKIRQCEKKVDDFHLKMIENATRILEINDEIKKTLKKINKVIRILTNKKFHQIKRIIMMAIDIIQAIILIKSLNLSKGLKSVNYSNLKKLAYLKIVQKIIGKIINSIHNLCAI